MPQDHKMASKIKKIRHGKISCDIYTSMVTCDSVFHANNKPQPNEIKRKESSQFFM